GLPGDPPDPAALPPGCVFRPRCPVALDICAVQDPPLRDTGDDRSAACVRITTRVTTPTAATDSDTARDTDRETDRETAADTTTDTPGDEAPAPAPAPGPAEEARRDTP
ncbi:ABC transporter ATP-binding protein, partial [Streptomyces sp. SID7804]|nr:ABC transporter ATP-binding protein [Streptomyces sp. SID7804]